MKREQQDRTKSDAVAEVANLLRVDPTARDKAPSTPLFRNPWDSTALTTDAVIAWTRRLMAAVVGPSLKSHEI